MLVDHAAMIGHTQRMSMLCRAPVLGKQAFACLLCRLVCCCTAYTAPAGKCCELQPSWDQPDCVFTWYARVGSCGLSVLLSKQWQVTDIAAHELLHILAWTLYSSLAKAITFHALNFAFTPISSNELYSTLQLVGAWTSKVCRFPLSRLCTLVLQVLHHSHTRCMHHSYSPKCHLTEGSSC